MDVVPRSIEFDERWRQSCRVQIAFIHVLAVEKQDVILGVNADSAKAAQRPSIREWLRPGEVRLVLDRARLRGYVGADVVGADLEVGPYDNREDCGRAGDDKQSNLRTHWLSLI